MFVPRPETEVMTGWAIEQLRPMISDTVARRWWLSCATGSGAIAKAIATEVTGRAVVHAVELSDEAAAYASRNLADTPVGCTSATWPARCPSSTAASTW